MIHEKIFAARLKAAMLRPYLAPAIFALSPVEKQGIGTLGVDEKWKMYYDPKVFEVWNNEHLAAVIIHEISHLLRDHPDRCRNNHANPNLFNVASDLEINSGLHEEGISLPPNLLFPDKFNLPKGLLAEEYYALLCKQEEEKCKQQAENEDKEKQQNSSDPENNNSSTEHEQENLSSNNQNDESETEHEQNVDQDHDGNDQDNVGEDNSSSENDDDQESDNGEERDESESGDDGQGNDESSNNSSETDSQLASSNSSNQSDQSESQDSSKGSLPLNKATDTNSGGLESEIGASTNNSPQVSSTPSNSDDELESFDNGKNQEVKVDNDKPNFSRPGAGQCGSCATGIREDYEDEGEEISSPLTDKIANEVAKRILKQSKTQGNIPAGWLRWATDRTTPKVDWRKELRSLIGKSLSKGSGAVDFTYQRPSRRQGSSPNIIFPSIVKPQPNLAVVVDTSGSISDAMISQVMAEIDAILVSQGQKDRLFVVACDREVHWSGTVYRSDQIQPRGGGGTDMRVGINKTLEQRPLPNAVIVVSDGYTEWPIFMPRGVKLIVALACEDKNQRDIPAFAKKITIN